ncbi:MAG: hypothetical protein IJM64_01540 [Ottowia sp.]|nr:hypothetical protein [Ottowia sp.]
MREAWGGYAAGSSTLAERNTLTVKGGTVSTAIGGQSEDGPATGNFVTIDGGTVYGVTGGSAGNGDATGNTVTLISGKVERYSVYGGDCFGPGCNEVSNILAVQGKDFQVGGYVRNFDTLNFTLPAGIAPNDTMLKVGRSAWFPSDTSTAPTTVTIAMADGAKLEIGKSVTLIETATTEELKITLADTTVTTADGYEFTLEKVGTTKLVATVIKEPDPTPTPTPDPDPTPTPTPDPDPTPTPSGGGNSSSPTMGELGLLLSGLALAGAAAPALRRREKQGKKADTRQ